MGKTFKIILCVVVGIFALALFPITLLVGGIGALIYSFTNKGKQNKLKFRLSGSAMLVVLVILFTIATPSSQASAYHNEHKTLIADINSENWDELNGDSLITDIESCEICISEDTEETLASIKADYTTRIEEEKIAKEESIKKEKEETEKKETEREEKELAEQKAKELAEQKAREEEARIQQELVVKETPVVVEEVPEEVTPQAQVQQVWITSSGTKYHSTSTCSNMKSPSQVGIDNVGGRDACSKCW